MEEKRQGEKEKGRGKRGISRELWVRGLGWDKLVFRIWK